MEVSCSMSQSKWSISMSVTFFSILTFVPHQCWIKHVHVFDPLFSTQFLFCVNFFMQVPPKCSIYAEFHQNNDLYMKDDFDMKTFYISSEGVKTIFHHYFVIYTVLFSIHYFVLKFWNKFYFNHDYSLLCWGKNYYCE